MAIQGTKKTQKQFDAFMHKNNMHIPGNHITIPAVDKFLNNVLPKNPTCQDCSTHTMHRFGYIQKFKDAGLSKGRYTGKDGNVIRTYSQEYNNDWVFFYAKKGKNAANRGLELNDGSPLMHIPHQVTNSMHFKAAIKALKQVK